MPFPPRLKEACAQPPAALPPPLLDDAPQREPPRRPCLLTRERVSRRGTASEASHPPRRARADGPPTIGRSSASLSAAEDMPPERTDAYRRTQSPARHEVSTVGRKGRRQKPATTRVHLGLISATSRRYLGQHLECISTSLPSRVHCYLECISISLLSRLEPVHELGQPRAVAQLLLGEPDLRMISHGSLYHSRECAGARPARPRARRATPSRDGGEM